MSQTNTASILVVDDELNIQAIIRKVLSIKGHTVTCASNVDDALTLLENGTFNLLITDHLMPGKTGLELVIEAQRRHPDVLKILLTGVGNRDLYREAINKGDIFSVIEKPFKSEQLVEAVQRAIDLYFRAVEEKRELLRIRDQYHTLFDTTTDLIQCVDTTGLFIYVNPAWHRVLGYSHDELEHMRAADIIHPDTIARMYDLMDRVHAGLPIDPFDCRFVAKNGAPVYLEGNVTAQYQDADVVALTYILRDITERKKAADEMQARLKQETMIARIANLLANTDRPVSVYSAILKIIGESANVDSAHIFEIDPTHNHMKRIDDWFMPGLSQETFTDISVIRNETPSLFKTITAGKNICYTDVNDIPCPDRDFIKRADIKALLGLPIHLGTEIVGCLCFFNYHRKRTWDDNEVALLRAGVDILANAWRRQLEIDVREEKEREAEQSRLLVIRADRLAALGTMTAGIIHEITQPLNAINVATQTILYGLQRGWEMDSRQIGNSLDLIVDQIKRMGNIIKDMRAFAYDGNPSEKEYDNLNRQIDRVLSILGEQMRAHGIEVIIDKGDIPDVMMNTQQILQVLMNLVTNARQALDEIDSDEKVLRIRTWREDDMVTLEVADNGPGVPPDIRERIFDPFFTTKEVGQGTGLGLSISMGFIQDHHGTLVISDTEGGGADFIMRLPLHRVDEGGNN